MHEGKISKPAYRILFVCLGNICRSPTAEGVFRHLAESRGLSAYIEVDSVGIGAWHVGNPPDPRAQQTALSNNIDLGELRARQISQQDFQTFDKIIAMDNQNLDDLTHLADPQHHHKLHLLLSFSPEIAETDVPDPWFGQENGFVSVFNMIDAACKALLEQVCHSQHIPMEGR